MLNTHQSPSKRQPPQLVNTASKTISIWRGLDRITFRRHAVALRRVSEIAGDEVVHSAAEWQSRHTSSATLLPFDVEQRLADDFAFIAAAEEILRVVSAVALEQYVEPARLIVRLAANEYIPNGVLPMFEHMFKLLGRSASSRKFSRADCAQAIFSHVMAANQRRIWSRLQPAPQDIPIGLAGKTHKPLHEEISDLCDELERQSSNIYKGSPLIVQQLRTVQEVIQRVSDYPLNSDMMIPLLKEVVLACHDVCTLDVPSSLEGYVQDHGFVTRENKYLLCIRQIDKLGRYWGLCKSTTLDSKRYPQLFENMKLYTLCPFKAATSLITAGRGQRAYLHVHAEMQILAFYGLKSSVQVPKPRVIGVSRAACYLCNLFIQKHGEFYVTKTHGWLFDAWNFPDLAATDTHQQSVYRQTLMKMDQEIQKELTKQYHNHVKRQKPMGSRLALPFPSTNSPVPSTTISTLPEANEIEPILLASPSTGASQVSEGADDNGSVSPAQLSSVKSNEPSTSPCGPLHSTDRALTAKLEDEVEPMAAVNSTVSLQCPIRRTISAMYPFRCKAKGISFTFEIEAPSRGHVCVAPVEDPVALPNGSVVDIGAMEDEQILTVARGNGEDNVSIHFRHPNGDISNIGLQWL